MDPTTDLARRIERGRAAIAGLAGRVEAGEPWPLSVAFGVEPEARWGPKETLAHVAEMLPFWQGEIERILWAVAVDPAAEPVAFGRVQANELRIGVIERDRTLPPAELLSRIDGGTQRFLRRLAELSPADLARRGVHQTLGEMTVEGIAVEFVAQHLEDHVRQLDESLDATVSA